MSMPASLGVCLDELAAWCDLISHQHREAWSAAVASSGDALKRPGRGSIVVSRSWSAFISPDP